jgi:hypothetical protein
MIPHHHQWMTLSYAVAPTFFGSRFILCETGPDQPLNLAAAEAVVGTYLALSVLVGDLVNQGTRIPARRRPALHGWSSRRPDAMMHRWMTPSSIGP